MKDNAKKKWGVEEYDNLADENGVIRVTVNTFAFGGHETLSTVYALKIEENHGTWWDVSASVESSDIYQTCLWFEFELEKNTPVEDLESVLKNV